MVFEAFTHLDSLTHGLVVTQHDTWLGIRLLSLAQDNTVSLQDILSGGHDFLGDIDALQIRGQHLQRVTNKLINLLVV